MQKAYNRINWENYPSTNSPLNEENLNRMDAALDTIDNRVIDLDNGKANQTDLVSLQNVVSTKADKTTVNTLTGRVDTIEVVKAEQSDLLQSLKTVVYDPVTGIFTFTKWNGVSYQADLNVEKIPVSFVLTADGILIMTTADGTRYACNIANLIKEITFAPSDQVTFDVVMDSGGNKTVTAHLVRGSITGDYLEPNYLDNVQQASQSARNSANNADAAAVLARSYAKGGTGTRQGENTDNAQFYSQQSASSAAAAELAKDAAEDAADAITELTTETQFRVNFTTGNLEYSSPVYEFRVNESTGNLEWRVSA